MFGLGKAKAVVGLDIGSSAVKAVELKPVGQGLQGDGVRASSRCRPTASSTARSSTARAVADAIRRLFENKAFKTKDVAASLSGNAVIVKKISLPVMTEAELAESIYWEAEQYIPFDIQDVNLDYQILDRRHRRRRRTARWTCCSSRRRRKRSPTTPASSRRPAACRSSSTSTPSRCRTRTKSTTASTPDAVVVLLNAGASAININILQRRPVGLHARHLDRRQRLHRGGAEGAEPAVRERRAAEEGRAGRRRRRFEEVRPVLHAMTENVLLEIQKTFDFFKATASSDRIDRIMLSGGASRVDGFAAGARGAVRRAGRDVRSVQEDRVRPGEARHRRIAERLAPTAAVAVGLALRRAGDR